MTIHGEEPAIRQDALRTRPRRDSMTPVQENNKK